MNELYAEYEPLGLRLLMLTREFPEVVSMDYAGGSLFYQDVAFDWAIDTSAWAESWGWGTRWGSSLAKSGAMIVNTHTMTITAMVPNWRPQDTKNAIREVLGLPPEN